MIIVKNGNVKVCGTGENVLVEYALLTDSLFETLGSKTGEAGERMVKAAYKAGKNHTKTKKAKTKKEKIKMRIISSECDYDAPYDKCFLSIRESNISGKFQIIASQYMTETSESHVMGNYNTAEDASKVLNSLRKCYFDNYAYYVFPKNSEYSSRERNDRNDSRMYRNRKQR